MKHIVVASMNPVKINAVNKAFAQMFPENSFSHEGINVSSEVNNQPMSDEETFRGAKNRAYNAKIHRPEADYRLGLEGGIEIIENTMCVSKWVYIINSDNIVGFSRGCSMPLPDKMKQLVDSGLELGEANDKVFNLTNSKQAGGTVATLTQNNITREDGFFFTLCHALVPFKNNKLFNQM